MRNRRRAPARFSFAFGCLALSCAPALAAPEPAKPVDMSRYLGRWYEIARLPSLLERNCQASTADYQREPDGRMTVIESCHQGAPDGPLMTHRVGVKVLDPGVNAKLRLSFFPLVSRDYWVLDHADNYDWAIVARSNTNYLWLFDRRPNPPPAEVATMVARAKALGYDTSRLIFTKQS